MTIRPRHYAELLLANAPAELVATRLEQLSAVASQARHLSQVATNPATKAAVTAALTELKIDALVQAMVVELAALGRLNWLRAIMRAAEAKLATSGAPLPVHITTAHDVIDEAALREQLTKLVGPISTIERTTDASQLGGIRVQAADRSLDTRLEHRLHQLRRMVRERNA